MTLINSQPNQKTLLSLLNKVRTQRVKQLDKDLISYLMSRSSRATIIEQAVEVLQQHGLLKWPLDEDNHKLVVQSYQQSLLVPAELRILISINWKDQVSDDIKSIWDSLSYQVQLFHYVHNITFVPSCVVCKTQSTRWTKKWGRYTKHCSNRCRALDPEVEAVRIQTCIERYGHDKSLSIPEHAEKSRSTSLVRHGTAFPFQNENIQESALTAYKVNHEHDLDYRSRQSKLSLANKYAGGDTSITFGKMFATDEYIQQRRSSFLQNWLPKRLADISGQSIPLFDLNQYTNRFQLLPWKCIQCNTEFVDCIRDGKDPRCSTCYPLNATSWNQDDVAQYIRNLVPDVVIGNRQIIGPLELDIYSPHHSIAVEYNGLYWHSEHSPGNNITKDYHLTKTEMCSAKGIRLIHIFEDEWINNKPIVQSILSSVFGGPKAVLYARKCNIKHIDAVTCNKFLKENHLQGADRASVRLALEINNTIVSVMTFGKSRFDKSCQWELIRFCNALNTSVVGGASRLFKHFIANYKPESISTYSDRRWFTGEVYNSLGFKFIGYTPPNHFYVNKRTGCAERFNRMGFQKHKLASKLDVYDPGITELANMKNNGYGRIWDCGNFKFIWKQK